MATAFSENLTAEQQSQVLQLFQQFQHPTLQKDLIELKTLKKVEKAVRYYVLNYNCLLHGTLAWRK